MMLDILYDDYHVNGVGMGGMSMRYEKGHKEQTRKRVVEVAAAQFRAKGIEGTGLAGLMADAGLTHGGFYAHFASKDDLVRSAVTAAMLGKRDFFAQKAKKAQERGADPLRSEESRVGERGRSRWSPEH